MKSRARTIRKREEKWLKLILKIGAVRFPFPGTKPATKPA
jgi:hypothetical protein